MHKSVIWRIKRRIDHIVRQGKLILPLRSENSIALVLQMILSEALVRRRVYAVKLDGTELKLRSFSSDTLLANSWLRQQLADHYSRLDDFDGIIVDAGGHIGMAAIIFAKNFPDRKIISLEPSSENFRLLEENVKGFSNIRPLNCALGPEDGEAELLDRTGSGDVFSLTAGSGQSADSEHVKVVSIPSLLAKCGAERIALLKLDIEGFERELLIEKPDWMARVGLVAIELHERFKPGSTRAYINATAHGRSDLGLSGEILFSVADRTKQ